MTISHSITTIHCQLSIPHNSNAMKLTYCVLAMLLPLIKANALPIEPLRVGDKVPSLPLKNIINAGYKNTSIAACKGKLLVLDFMATTCKGCIIALPRLDSLQAKYKNSLQIFLVTYEDAATLKTFLAHNHIGQQVHLPFVTGDTLLAKYFPHVWLSHDVWINPAQQVLAITEAEYVNDSNVVNALTGKAVNWPLKLDFALHDDSKPFLNYTDADSFYFKKPAAASYTFLSGYINTRAISFLFKKDTVNNVQRFCITNYPVVQMYQLVYDAIYLPHGHIQLQVKDTPRYIYKQGAAYFDVWNSKNRYCYEALLPIDMQKQAVQEKVVADLNNYFGLQASFKQREVPCLVLRDTMKTTSEPTGADTTHTITLHNLLYGLNNNQYGTPVLNESSANNDLLLPLCGTETIEEINTVLAHFGLVFLKLNRTTQILTIAEKSATE
jgi:thiol-disulfide isomerase/thioredoxin